MNIARACTGAEVPCVRTHVVVIPDITAVQDIYIHLSDPPLLPLPSPPLPLPSHPLPHFLQPLPAAALPTGDTTASHKSPTRACQDQTVPAVKEHCTSQTASLCHHQQLAIATNVHRQRQAAAVGKTRDACPCPAHTLLCSCDHFSYQNTLCNKL